MSELERLEVDFLEAVVGEDCRFTRILDVTGLYNGCAGYSWGQLHGTKFSVLANKHGKSFS